MTPPATRDVLLTAKEVLNYQGWCKLTYENPRGEVCVTEAVCRACESHGARNLGHALPALKALESLVGMPLTLWNDMPETTYEDVVQALTKAADNATPTEEVNGV